MNLLSEITYEKLQKGDNKLKKLKTEYLIKNLVEKSKIINESMNKIRNLKYIFQNFEILYSIIYLKTNLFALVKKIFTSSLINF